jgi:DNA sulfur modification protein DndB
MKCLAWNIGNGDVDCFVTVMNAKHLFNITEVSRADENPTEGYQRLLSPKRAKSIAAYLDEGNIIPGAIILSTKEGCRLKYVAENNSLELEDLDSKLFVIDGQHRLYGASISEKDISLPVCIFSGLDLKQEVQYFLDINSNQVGVPKTLRIELLKFLTEPESKGSILVKMFRELGDDVVSPLYGRIAPISSIPGKLSHVPFHSSLEKLIDTGTLKNFDYEGKKILIIHFLNAASNVLKEFEGNDKRLATSVFFQALFLIFEDVCSYAITYYRNYSESSFIKILSGINKINFENHSGTNSQNIKSLADDLRNLIELNVRTLETPYDLLG